MRTISSIVPQNFDSAKHAQFLEISVFDSGSGLAQTWLARHGELANGIIEDQLPLDQEYRAVLKCLSKGGTTSGAETRGFGLFRITNAVKRCGGFIRIRTGRLSRVKAFNEIQEGFDDDDLIFDDAILGGGPKTAQSWSDGTTITIMVPLNRRLGK